MILQIQRLQPHPNDIQTPYFVCLFVCLFVFLIAILLLAICFKYYCSATSENLLGHKIDLSIFSHFQALAPDWTCYIARIANDQHGVLSQ